LFIKKIVAPKNQYAVFLLNVGRHNAGDIIFMFNNERVGFFEQRFFVNRLNCLLHSLLLTNCA